MLVLEERAGVKKDARHNHTQTSDPDRVHGPFKLLSNILQTLNFIGYIHPNYPLQIVLVILDQVFY